MKHYQTQPFPRSRIATIDIGAIGKGKHHIAGLIEVDVTRMREEVRQLKQEQPGLSLTACLIRVISQTIHDHRGVAGFLSGKRQVTIFDDINVSLIVEKDLNGKKVPIPLVIEKAQERSPASISAQIWEAKNKKLSGDDIVLQQKSKRLERIYFLFPGFIRRTFWRYLLRHPQLAYSKMGNVAITSIGMMGQVNGWFIPLAVHPVCIGISTIVKKPVVRNDRIEIREILNMTVLLDHDVIDGAPMARFISDLSRRIENGISHTDR